MSEGIKPQVGDIWELAGETTRIRITAVGETKILGVWPSGEKNLGISELNEFYTLIERDGKPFKPKRVFELNEYYQARYPSGQRTCLKCVGENVFMAVGSNMSVGPDLFEWIGPELRWPVKTYRRER
tara:strand:+ start:310 stop:690 length:381 start_codon:yes stop_codon:yes gene_type:complete